MGDTKHEPARKRAVKPKDRIELQAPLEWVRKLDAAAEALGMSRSAFIRYACNKQMERDKRGD